MKFWQQEKEEAKDGTDSPSVSACAEAESTKALELIAVCQSMLMAKIEVKIDISLIRQDISKLRVRVTEAKTRIIRAEDSLHPLQHTTEDMQRQIQQLTSKQDNIEDRLRRSVSSAFLRKHRVLTPLGF